jgi:phosphoribosyl-AMP cyclohydrolase
MLPRAPSDRDTVRSACVALDPAIAARLKRDAAGLVAAVVQQYDTGEVLMVGWMDDDALHRTLTTGRATYWSRSRQEYWVKGDTSGHVQHVKSVALDCDGDALLVRVDQVGAACHTGDRTCFDSGVIGDERLREDQCEQSATKEQIGPSSDPSAASGPGEDR